MSPAARIWTNVRAVAALEPALRLRPLAPTNTFNGDQRGGGSHHSKPHRRVLGELRAPGELITTCEIEHISPLAHQHIHLCGHYAFDLATRPDGRRPPSRSQLNPRQPASKAANLVQR